MNCMFLLDRCHRMGQTRPVTIYRLLSAGTIEEGIYQVAQEKLNLEKHVTGADGKSYNHYFKSMLLELMEVLQTLFKSMLLG